MCKHCGDEVARAWRCEECKGFVGAACRECHAESHGVVAPPTPTRGSRADAAITRRLRDDPSPWDENATRAREDA